jgi:Fe-S cluster assembly protein SufD
LSRASKLIPVTFAAVNEPSAMTVLSANDVSGPCPGVVDGQSHAVFAGKIIVHKPAQKTDAFQTNNNLLLSDDAEIDTKPELEIYADDVKCSHGATVGDLDPTALFYLRSRGMPLPTAKSLLVYGWASEVIERMRDDTLRSQARKAVLARLPGAASLDGLE